MNDQIIDQYLRDYAWSEAGAYPYSVVWNDGREGIYQFATREQAEQHFQRHMSEAVKFGYTRTLTLHTPAGSHVESWTPPQPTSDAAEDVTDILATVEYWTRIHVGWASGDDKWYVNEYQLAMACDAYGHPLWLDVYDGPAVVRRLRPSVAPLSAGVWAVPVEVRS